MRHTNRMIAGFLAGIAFGCVTVVAAEPPVSVPAAIEKDLVIQGGSLHYVERGSGPPVLILSGGPGFSGDYMTPIAVDLARSYRTFVLDQRGTGHSHLASLDASTMSRQLAVEDLEVLRRALGVEHWMVVGHSWGAMLAMSYVVAHPEPISTLILIDAGGPTGDFVAAFGDNLEARMSPSDKEARDYWVQPDVRQADPARAAAESLKARVPAYFFDRKNAFAYIAQITAEGYNATVNQLMMEDLFRTGYDLRAGLRKVKAPTLIIRGRQDPVAESVSIEEHALLSNSELHFVERAGHFPWLEKPKEFFLAMHAYLDGLPPVGHHH
jgi:proline iminopeptidase